MLRFTWKTELIDGVVIGWLKDPAGRIVASGKGSDERVAQQRALETSASEDAKQYLQQTLFVAAPTT